MYEELIASRWDKKKKSGLWEVRFSSSCSSTVWLLYQSDESYLNRAEKLGRKATMVQQVKEQPGGDHRAFARGSHTTIWKSDTSNGRNIAAEGCLFLKHQDCSEFCPSMQPCWAAAASFTAAEAPKHCSTPLKAFRTIRTLGISVKAEFSTDTSLFVQLIKLLKPRVLQIKEGKRKKNSKGPKNRLTQFFCLVQRCTSMEYSLSQDVSTSPDISSPTHSHSTVSFSGMAPKGIHNQLLERQYFHIT